MVDVENLPAWARRRLDRHFKRGGSGRIVRWMSVSAGAVADPVADAPPAEAGAPLLPGNILVFARSAAPAAPEPARSLAG